MDKKLNIIDILFFLYIFFLPFIKIGIRIFSYTFSISDIILIIIFFYYFFKRFNNFAILQETKIFLILYLIFLTFILFSLITAINIKSFIADYLTYIYGAIIIVLFSLYIKEKMEIKVIKYAFFISLLLIISTSIIFFTRLKIRTLITFKNYNFLFFMRLPNQLALYLIICFSLYLLFKENFPANKFFNIIHISLPFLFFVAVVITGSGVGMCVAFLLTGYSYLLDIKKIKSISKALYLIFGVIAIVGLFIFLLKNSPNAFFLIKKESKLILKNIYSFSLVKGDMREENFRIGFNLFCRNPINGVGLGNVKGNYTEYEIHNSYLSILAETGLLGFIPLILLLLYILIFIFKYANSLERLIRTTLIYGGVLFYALLHYVIRERWWWLFLIILFNSIIINRQSEYQ